MIQLILHLIGDYITQSDWMAMNKTKRFWPAHAHAVSYSLPFCFIGSWRAVLFIAVTHFFIDRYRLARYVVFAKNWLFSPDPVYWRDCKLTGYPSNRPDWMAIWLLIIADNTIHLACNYAALALL